MTHDQESAIKARQTANLLVQDLRTLVSSDNPLLSDVALDLLESAAQLEQRLRRLEGAIQGATS